MEPETGIDAEQWVQSLPTREVLRLSRITLRELRARGLVRTLGAPGGELAEYLVARAYAGTLAPNSEKGWDVRASDGRKLQVKSRVQTGGPVSLFGAFRSFDFDAAVLVLLSGEDLSVVKALELAPEVIQERAQYRRRVNGWVVRRSIMELIAPGVTDVTEQLNVALASLAPDA